MKILELFAGTASFSSVAKLGEATVFTSDYDPQFDTDYCVDINDFDTNKLPFKPDVVWASPPCESFSVASIGKHWNIDNTPKSEQAKDALVMLAKTVDVIAELNPKTWYIENPRGKMRKIIPKMIDDKLGNFWVMRTVTYCQYGDTRMKPTDIFTNDLNWQPKPVCKNGMPCHIAAPRGSRTGTQGIKTYKDRSRIPTELCSEIITNLIRKEDV